MVFAATGNSTTLQQKISAGDHTYERSSCHCLSERSKSIEIRDDKHTYASLSHPLLSGVVLQIFVGKRDRHAALADR